MQRCCRLPHTSDDLEGPPLEACSIQGQHTISPLHLAKLNQVARQHSHFAVMHGETGFARIDSSLPEIKAVGQVWMHLVKLPMNSPFQIA